MVRLPVPPWSVRLATVMDPVPRLIAEGGSCTVESKTAVKVEVPEVLGTDPPLQKVPVFHVVPLALVHVSVVLLAITFRETPRNERTVRRNIFGAFIRLGRFAMKRGGRLMVYRRTLKYYLSAVKRCL